MIAATGTQLTTSFQVLHTVPPNLNLNLSSIFIVNTDAAQRTVKLCFVAPGKIAVQSNAMLWSYPIAANDFIEIGSGQIIPAQYSIQALADSAGVVNIRISGNE